MQSSGDLPHRHRQPHGLARVGFIESACTFKAAKYQYADHLQAAVIKMTEGAMAWREYVQAQNECDMRDSPVRNHVWPTDKPPHAHAYYPHATRSPRPLPGLLDASCTTSDRTKVHTYFVHAISCVAGSAAPWHVLGTEGQTRQ